jgi:tetratricopeptide (TPR) repeat protein
MQNERLHKLNDMLVDNPNDSFLLFALAKEFEKQHEPQKALDTFLQLIETNPDYTGTYLHLGKLYEQLGDTANAETIYRQGVGVCEALNAHHDMSELRTALSFLKDEMEGLDD